MESLVVVPDSVEDLLFRKLTSRHTDVVVALADRVCSETLDSVLSDVGRASYRDRVRWHRILTTRHVTGAFLRDGSLVAFAAVQHDAEATSSHLSCNFVAVRGAGIGSRLVELRLEQARAHGSVSVSANVNDCNASSIAMLVSCGFVQVGDVADAWSPHRLLTFSRAL